MKAATKIRFWLASLYTRRKFRAEMEAHLEMRVERNVAAGMLLSAARDSAKRAFGGIDQSKERARDERGGSWFIQMCQDSHYGMRMLRKNPVFTAIALPAWRATRFDPIDAPRWD